MLAALVFAPAAHAETCNPAALKVTTTPIPPQYERTMQRHMDLLARIPEGIDVVAIGDSLIQGWPADQLNALYPGRTVWNAGVGSDKTQMILWRLDAPEMARVRPREVMLLIGTNNLSAGDPACAIATGVVRIVARLKELWRPERITVLLPLPRRDRTAERDLANAEIAKSLSGEANVRLLDLSDALAPGGELDAKAYAADRLHLNRHGYETLTRAMRGAR